MKKVKCKRTFSNFIFPSIFSSLLFVISCTKTDFQKDEPTVTENHPSAFFKLPLDASPTLIRVINVFKTLEKVKPFAQEFEEHNGIPVWNKILYQNLHSSANFSPNLNNSGPTDTFAVIPVVMANTNYVSGFITLSLN